MLLRKKVSENMTEKETVVQCRQSSSRVLLNLSQR